MTELGIQCQQIAQKRFIENRILISEFELANYIKEFYEEENKTCPSCGARNFDFSEIEIAGKKAKIGEDVDQFILVIMKHENNQIELKVGGSKYLPKGFVPEAFELIEETFHSIPSHEFESKRIGNLRFVVSSGFIGNDANRTNRLEQFSFVGFDKAQIQDLFDQLKPQLK